MNIQLKIIKMIRFVSFNMLLMLVLVPLALASSDNNDFFTLEDVDFYALTHSLKEPNNKAAEIAYNSYFKKDKSLNLQSKSFNERSNNRERAYKKEKSLSWTGSYLGKILVIIVIVVVFIFFLCQWLRKKNRYDHAPKSSNKKTDSISGKTKKMSSKIDNRDTFNRSNNSTINPPVDVSSRKKIVTNKYKDQPSAVKTTISEDEIRRIVKEEMGSVNSEFKNIILKFSDYVRSLQHTIEKMANELLVISKKTESFTENVAQQRTETLDKFELPVQPKTKVFNQVNLVSWWNTHGNKNFSDCKQSLIDTFGVNITVNLVKPEDEDAENWNLIAINEKIGSYYIMPRNLCSYTTLLQDWFSNPNQDTATNLRILSLKNVASAKKTMPDFGYPEYQLLEKGTVEVGK